MVDFTVELYSGQSATKRMTITRDSRVSGNINYFNFIKSNDTMYQTGVVKLYNIKEEPVINDKVTIDINGTNKFTGYVRAVDRVLEKSDTRVVRLIGKTYDLWREPIASGNAEYGNDYTSNIIKDILDTYTSIDTTLMPTDSGQIISGKRTYLYFSVGDAIETVSEYDDYRFFIDKDDKFHYYKPSTNQKTITESNLIKVKDIKKNDKDIWNHIIVVGSGNIVSQVSNQTSIDTYGKYLKIIRDYNINKSGDATSLANKYLTEYATPVYEGTILIDGDETLDLEQEVELSFTNLNITGNHEITSLKHKFDEMGFTTELRFGRAPFNPSIDVKNLNIRMVKSEKKITEIQGTSYTRNSTMPSVNVTISAFPTYYDVPATNDQLITLVHHIKLSGNTGSSTIKHTCWDGSSVYYFSGQVQLINNNAGVMEERRSITFLAKAGSRWHISRLTTSGNVSTKATIVNLTVNG